MSFNRPPNMPMHQYNSLDTANSRRPKVIMKLEQNMSCGRVNSFADDEGGLDTIYILLLWQIMPNYTAPLPIPILL